MFIINGEIFNANTHKTEHEWMQKKLKEIRDSGRKTYTFSAFRKRAMYLREDGRMIPQKDRMRLVSVIGSTSDANGMYQTWAYAPSMNALESDGSGGYNVIRKSIQLQFDTVFSVEQDIELIFFFLYLSQNRHVKLQDYEAQRKEQALATSLQVKASSLIYSDDSPIHPDNVGSEEKLRNVALAWGVPGALSIDVYQVMHELWAKVNEGEKKHGAQKKGFKEFIDEVTKYSSTEQRATIVKAIQQGYLVYDNSLWKLKTSGGSETFLCGVPPTDARNKDEYVMQYVLNNQLVFEALEAALEEPPFKEEKKTETTTTVVMKRQDLMDEAKKLGWTGSYYREITKLNRDQLQELVDERRVPLVDKV